MHSSRREPVNRKLHTHRSVNAENIMIQFKSSVLSIVVGACLIACGGGGKPVANNTSDTASLTGPPPAESIVDLERSGWNARKNKSPEFWNSYLSDKFIGVGPDGPLDKAAAIKLFAEEKAEINNYTLSDHTILSLGADAVIFNYKVARQYVVADIEKNDEAWISSIYIREGTLWKKAYYNEYPWISLPDVSQGKPPASEAAANRKQAGHSNTADAVTEEWLAIEKKRWDAWKAHDKSSLDAIVSNELFGLNAAGNHNYTEMLDLWSGERCVIKSYSLTDASSRALTDDLSILVYKAVGDGTCGDRPITPTWNTSAFVQNRDKKWMLFFVSDSPAK